MAKHSVREDFHEAPWTTSLSALGASAAYAATGVLRPRWLTAPSRRTARQWGVAIAVRLLLLTWLRVGVQPWFERNQRAHADLTDELGRPPTPEEQITRMERLKADRS